MPPHSHSHHRPSTKPNPSFSTSRKTAKDRANLKDWATLLTAPSELSDSYSDSYSSFERTSRPGPKHGVPKNGHRLLFNEKMAELESILSHPPEDHPPHPSRPIFRALQLLVIIEQQARRLKDQHPQDPKERERLGSRALDARTRTMAWARSLRAEANTPSVDLYLLDSAQMCNSLELQRRVLDFYLFDKIDLFGQDSILLMGMLAHGPLAQEIRSKLASHLETLEPAYEPYLRLWLDELNRINEATDKSIAANPTVAYQKYVRGHLVFGRLRDAVLEHLDSLNSGHLDTSALEFKNSILEITRHREANAL